MRQGNFQDLAKFDDSCSAGRELRASMDKVSLLLNSLTADKAYGPDNIPPKLLKFLGCDVRFVQAVKTYSIGAFRRAHPNNLENRNCSTFARKRVNAST